MVATIPGSRLVTLKDKGHMLPFEDPDAVTDEIVARRQGLNASHPRRGESGREAPRPS